MQYKDGKKTIRTVSVKLKFGIGDVVYLHHEIQNCSFPARVRDIIYSCKQKKWSYYLTYGHENEFDGEFYQDNVERNYDSNKYKFEYEGKSEYQVWQKLTKEYGV